MLDDVNWPRIGIPWHRRRAATGVSFPKEKCGHFTGKHTKKTWKITMRLMGKLTIAMAIFNSYVCSPEGRCLVGLLQQLKTPGSSSPKTVPLGETHTSTWLGTVAILSYRRTLLPSNQHMGTCSYMLIHFEELSLILRPYPYHTAGSITMKSPLKFLASIPSIPMFLGENHILMSSYCDMLRYLSMAIDIIPSCHHVKIPYPLVN